MMALDRKSETFPEIEVTVGAGPDKFVVAQNYPNPFNAGTVIRFATPEAGDYTLTIFDITGRRVWSTAGRTEAGWVDIGWNGRSTNGGQVASGVYLYRVTTPMHSLTKKMTLLK